MKKVTVKQVEAFKSAVAAEAQKQQERLAAAEEKLASVQDQDSLKEASDEASNAKQRLRWCNKLQISSTEHLQKILPFVEDQSGVVAPRDLYMMEFNAWQLASVAAGVMSPEKLSDKLARFFVPFAKRLTVSGQAVQQEVQKAIKDSNGRWAKGTAYAVSLLGGCTFEQVKKGRGTELVSVTIKPESAIVQALQEKSIIGKLASE